MRLHGLLSCLTKLAFSGHFSLLIAIVLVFLWAVIFKDLHQLHERSFDKGRSEGSLLAHAFAEQVETTVKLVDGTLLDLRHEWNARREAFRESVSRKGKQLENDLVFQIAVTDASGILVYSSIDPNLGPVSLRDITIYDSQENAPSPVILN